MKFEAPPLESGEHQESRENLRVQWRFRKLVSRVVLAAALATGISAMAQEKPNISEKEGPRLELSEKKIRSLYTLFHKEGEDARVKESIARAKSSSGSETDPGLTPMFVQKGEIILSGDEALPWLSKNAKGEEVVEISKFAQFDSAGIETEEDIRVDFKLAGGKEESVDGGGRMLIDLKRAFHNKEESLRTEKRRVGIYDEEVLFRPRYSANPEFYKGSLDLLTSEFSIRTTADNPSGLEYAHDSKQLRLPPEMVAKEADERLALQRIREFGKKMGLEEIISATDDLLANQMSSDYFLR
jgi:hypothetical protein